MTSYYPTYPIKGGQDDSVHANGQSIQENNFIAKYLGGNSNHG